VGDQNPDLAARVPTVRTGRQDGHHVYFVPDPPLKTKDLGDGELRADGAYVLAPPSVHPNGPTYKWQIPIDGELPKLDPTLFCPPDCATVHQTAPCPPGRTKTFQDPSWTQQDQAGHEGRSLGSDSWKSVEPAILQAIDETVPTEARQRHKQLFEFVRALHAIPGLRGMPPDTFKPYLRTWYKRALPVIVNARTFEENWWDFAESWDKVHFPKGEGVVTALLEKAKTAPIPRIVKTKGYEDEEIVLLVRLCRELQQHHGQDPFHLSGDKAGQALGMHPKRAYRCLRGLCVDGVLKLVRSGNTHRANEYRYLGD